MSQKQVAGWLKGITLSIAGMGLLFFGLVVPYLAWDMAVTYPDYAALRIPGILYGWGIAVFCYAILYQFWKVCVQIGRDNSFSGENARSFVVISRLAFVLAVVWFAGILFLAAKRALGPAFLIFSPAPLSDTLLKIPDRKTMPHSRSSYPSDFQIQSTLSLPLQYHRHSLSPDMQRHKSEHIQPVSSVLHICAD